MPGNTQDGRRQADSIARALAMQAVHVGRGTAQVGDDAGEALHLVADGFDFANDGILRTALNDSALMFGDRTEGTAAEAAALNGHGESNHVIRRNLRLAIDGMRAARVGQFVNRVHVRRAQGNRRRIQPQLLMSRAAAPSARAFPGLDSRCKMRDACAYSTGSLLTCSKDGMRMTLRSRCAFGTLR